MLIFDCGLAGGFASFELSYIQSVRSAAYVEEAYLPLALIMNRTLAAAITVSGLWFGLANWIALRSRALPELVSAVGLAAGAMGMLGFVLPGGGFSPVALLISALWGIVAGVGWLRRGGGVSSDR